MQKGILLKKSAFIQEFNSDVWEQYDMEKELGSGAFGKVFVGKRRGKPGTLRAIKMIRKQYINSQATSEVLILKMLDHPSLLKLYQIYHHEDYIYLVTDYFEGGDLFQRLEKRGEFTEEQAKDIFRQVLEAVAYCHSQHIVHRDIKPENLMFLNSKSLTLKLIDFGLAARWNQDLRKELRRLGKVTGSVYYVSPEIIANNYSEKCDIWSLGVVLYVMVTAQFPFDGQDDKEIMKNITSGKFTTESKRCSMSVSAIEGSADLKDLLQRLLSNEAKRPSATEVFEHPWLQRKQNGPAMKLNFSKLANFSKFSKIKTLAVTFIASQLPEKEIQKLAALFRHLDLNHDGYLSIEQLRVAFQRQKEKAALVQLSKLLEFIDTDRNGKINYTEFISCCLQNSVIFRQENLKAAFRMLDTDDNGKIEKKQLISILKGRQKRQLESNLAIDSSVIEDMIKACDKNGDGFIDYKEFVENISRH